MSGTPAWVKSVGSVKKMLYKLKSMGGRKYPNYSSVQICRDKLRSLKLNKLQKSLISERK